MDRDFRLLIVPLRFCTFLVNRRFSLCKDIMVIPLISGKKIKVLEMCGDISSVMCQRFFNIVYSGRRTIPRHSFSSDSSTELSLPFVGQRFLTCLGKEFREWVGDAVYPRRTGTVVEARAFFLSFTRSPPLFLFSLWDVLDFVYLINTDL
jgi:hypothetical protein